MQNKGKYESFEQKGRLKAKITIIPKSKVDSEQRLKQKVESTQKLREF